jgi:hypothetical protein
MAGITRVVVRSGRGRTAILGTLVIAVLSATPAMADATPDAVSAVSAQGAVRAERPAERVDNVRLQRVTEGPMRGRLIVAGSLDHIREMNEAREVTVRMTLSVPRRDGGWRTIGTKDMDYRLPPRVSPQDMTLRWILSPVRSRIVTRAGDAARLSVVVRESGTSVDVVTYRKTVKSLRIEPLIGLGSFAVTPRAIDPRFNFFIPGGYYASDVHSTFYLWTAEDFSGAPYVGGLGYAGTATYDYRDYWALEPFWVAQGAASGIPGPDGGYVSQYADSHAWSMNALRFPACTVSTWASGLFSDATDATMAWEDIYCAPGQLIARGGSASLSVQSD